MRYLGLLLLVMLAAYLWDDYYVAELCAREPSGMACWRSQANPVASYMGVLVAFLPIPMLLMWVGLNRAKALPWVISGVLGLVLLSGIVLALIRKDSGSPAAASALEPRQSSVPVTASAELTDFEKCADLKTLMTSPSYLKKYSDSLVTMTSASFDAECNPTLRATVNMYTSAFNAKAAKASMAKEVCAAFGEPSMPSTMTRMNYEFKNLKGMRLASISLERSKCQETARVTQ